jgi:hypothetical protein
MNGRRPDAPALIFGIVFLGIAGWWLLDRSIGLDLPSAGWIIAGILILLGVAGVSSALRNNAGPRSPE